MKILFVGTFEKSHSTHYPIVREFKKKNHQIIKFDFRKLSLKYRKIKTPLYYMKFKMFFISFIRERWYLPTKIRNIKYYLFGNWGMNRQLIHYVKNNKFDLVFFGKADDINFKLIPKINKYSKTFYYFMDPLYISYEMNAHRYARLCTASSASTTAMNQLFKREGANSSYILEGYDVEVFNPSEENKHKELNVIFVGSKIPIRAEYINFLRKNNINVTCYGPGWENKPIYLEELVKKYRQSKIILNFPREDSGFSDRVFQAMGTSSLLLSRFCSDLERVFKKSIHMDWFKTLEECLKLIKYYLENNEIREKVSKDGYNYVRENYTWENTVERLLKIIELYCHT